ncbi:Rieske (2Fe-2S) protein [Streptomyces sparsogenes]|uniref:Ferredoxin subunits of nitrite reductase and ring-hydroxylating dioxygenase-like protein n=1 Tax=Streptomyces sparsogenes DSM 40356 TaxID=1331668 RepID=A0A1R1S8K2_9ACTN|nr:Rieske (2Fe-2S) protein [Streptomyces sparsogenes]OMI34573.1 Ferredoxin subunits of nitrite reductase and ring-hydroxylating dioxygenase-like protein [Streptomyces sparsogenes DSM 40356]
MAEPATTGRATTRRCFLTAAGAAGLAAALTACGGGDDSSSAAPSQGGGGKGMELAKTSDIPEGGGKVFKDHQIVVTQPKAGEFKAFSSVCPHAGNPVGDVSGGTINCPFHGSKFSITDGSVQAGPSPKPLPGAEIEVKGGTISMA